MQTELADFIRHTPEGEEAQSILRKCVHCGFCTATCPTYQVLGDDLDSPRGRIYLMKRALEGAAVTDKTRLHLDRCLTCRSCETTCPSGVRFKNSGLPDRYIANDFVTYVWNHIYLDKTGNYAVDRPVSGRKTDKVYFASSAVLVWEMPYWMSIGSAHRNGINLVFADNHANFEKRNPKEEDWWAYNSRRGWEKD